MDFTRGDFKPKSASSILQALSCRFFGCNLLVFVFLAFKICLCFVQFKTPPRDFSKQGRPHFRQRQACRLLTRQSVGKKPSSIVQVQRSLISIVGKSRDYLDYSISTDKSQNRACRFGLKFPLVKSILPPASGRRIL